MEFLKKFYGMSKSKVTDTGDIKSKTIRILLKLIKSKDEYTAEHCIRVMKLAVGYAKHYNYPRSKVNTLKYASLLHDIGKIVLPKKILNKSDKLSPEEFRKIKQHPITGFHITRKIIFLRQEAQIIKQHHERVDGLGYPFGLRRDEIDELSKILSVCDAFDAMTSKRIYTKMLSRDEALTELCNNAGNQFDEGIVEQFCNYIKVKCPLH